MDYVLLSDYCIKLIDMKTIFAINNRLKVKEVTYETGDNFVIANCEILVDGKVAETKIKMSHTDLNRIISKLIANGYEFNVEKMNHLKFNDGTEIVDYKFENVFGESVVLDNFQFQQNVKQIRA